MSQHDMNIANQGFPAFRADLNSALAALVSNNSGATAPTTTFANMPWYDTTNNIFKIRNEDNDAWISVFTLDQTTDAITAIGSVTLADIVSLTGTQTLTNKTLTNPTLTNPTVDKINTGIANAVIGAGNASIMKNRIINGAMVIDQRNAGASVTPSTLYNTYVLDRWNTVYTTGSKFSVQQVASSVAGFPYSQKITSAGAYSVPSGELYTLGQNIEGYNIADLGWGTANAKTVTLSFWVQSSLTGTFGGALTNSDTSRSHPFSYTISSANTWEYKTITVAGDTTGTWLTTNGIGIQLRFGLGVGSTYSGTAGSWAGATYYSATGATSVVGTSGATFYITGVQLEIGSSATGFEYRQYGTELALCQRYFYIQGGGVYTRFGGGIAIGRSSTVVTSMTMLPVAMRTFPTITASSIGSTNINGSAVTGLTTNSAEASVGYPLTGPIRMVATVSGGITTGSSYEWEQASGTSTISYSAEL